MWSRVTRVLFCEVACLAARKDASTTRKFASSVIKSTASSEIFVLGLLKCDFRASLIMS